MTNKPNVFSGRIVIDHQTKTGGMAVSTWLRDILGDGVVSPDIAGNHQSAIRQYGGIYSIISGHVDFQGEGFDPRYKYLTLLREPVDRILSWLFYAAYDAPETPNYQRDKQASLVFLESEGQIIPEEIMKVVSNNYTMHFSQVFRNTHYEVFSEDQLLTLAIEALKKYDILGFFDQMPQYLKEVADLIGILPPESIAKVNVTSKRLHVSGISDAFRTRIINLNHLDIQLFNAVHAWKDLQSQTFALPMPTLTATLWDKYNLAPERVVISKAIILGSATLTPGYNFYYSEPITFDVDIFLTRNINELNIGLQIFDSNMRCAFGINTMLLNQIHRQLSIGSHRITYNLFAHLPVGKYSIGIACTEMLPSESCELLWRDKLCQFEVFHHTNHTSIGYANLLPSISFVKLDLGFENSVVNQPLGNLKVIGFVNSMRTSQQILLDVIIQNFSAEPWLDSVFIPINISYHWYDRENNPIVFDGVRTKLPQGGISPEQTVQTQITVLAPQQPGDYVLFITLVQESCAWFEDFGNDFSPALIEVSVS